MEHEIGTKITLEVVERVAGCERCFFGKTRTCLKNDDWECDAEYRTDHKNIIYKEVKEDLICGK